VAVGAQPIYPQVPVAGLQVCPVGQVTAAVPVSVQLVGLPQLSVPASHAFDDGVQALPATHVVQVPATQAPPVTVLQVVPSATGTPVSTQLGGVGGIAVGSPQLSDPW
jgi:hypothetical protein